MHKSTNSMIKFNSTFFFSVYGFFYLFFCVGGGGEGEGEGGD